MSHDGNDSYDDDVLAIDVDFDFIFQVDVVLDCHPEFSFF